MRQGIKMIALAAVVCLLALILTACGTDAGQPLSDIHQEGQLENLSFIDGNPCLKCHSSDNIIKATENYGGQSNLNIHQPPEPMKQHYGDCMTCHRRDASPTITCNQCHSFKLSSGWE